MPYACDTRLDVPNQFVSRYERPTLLLDLLQKHVQGLKIWGVRYRQLDNGGCSFQEPMNRQTAFRSYPLGWCKPTDGHHAQKIKLPIIITTTLPMPLIFSSTSGPLSPTARTPPLLTTLTPRTRLRSLPRNRLEGNSNMFRYSNYAFLLLLLLF